LNGFVAQEEARRAMMTSQAIERQATREASRAASVSFGESLANPP
jgi:hypothetical protein